MENMYFKKISRGHNELGGGGGGGGGDSLAPFKHNSWLYSHDSASLDLLSQ